jgi:hypothetical protein
MQSGGGVARPRPWTQKCEPHRTRATRGQRAQRTHYRKRGKTHSSWSARAPVGIFVYAQYDGLNDAVLGEEAPPDVEAAVAHGLFVEKI